MDDERRADETEHSKQRRQPEPKDRVLSRFFCFLLIGTSLVFGRSLRMLVSSPLSHSRSVPPSSSFNRPLAEQAMAAPIDLTRIACSHRVPLCDARGGDGMYWLTGWRTNNGP